ncbi:MAG: hypothetical protein HYU64_10325 [Armatimonadetes bacterium]|nr:hypothetical protein [Armatimonadota bacterium]
MKVHLRYNGESRTLDGDEWGITENTDDRTLKSLVSETYGLSTGALGKLVVDRNPDGVILRPPAIFG